MRRPMPLGLLGIAAGTVLAAAGVVSQQVGSPLRSTAVLFALALLWAGGQHGLAVLRRAPQSLPGPSTPDDPFPVPWPSPPGPSLNAPKAAMRGRLG